MSWGYNTAEALEKEKPDYLVKSPLELEKLVFSETNYKIIKMIFRILNKIIIHDDDDYDPNHIGCLDR